MGYYEWPIFDFDEERDPELFKVWILDRKETLRAVMPFGIWMGMANYNQHALQYAPNILSIPTAKGLDWRLKDGWEYVGIMVTSEEEQREREPKFRERIAPWIDDFGKEWGKFVAELMGHYNRLKAVDVEKADDVDLRMNFLDWVWVYRREAEIHMVTMYAFCSIYILFEEVCKELLGIDKYDPLFGKLMSGFDNKLLDTDRGLWRLGDRAKELGLEQTFKDIPDDEELLSKLEETEAGRKWLQELREFVEEYGWRTRENWDVTYPSWVEQPSLALPAIRRDMAVGGVFIRDQALQRSREERAEAEKEILSRVPEDKREWFEKLMKAAQWSGIVAEEHVFYTENYANATGRRITKEIGKRFAQAGVIDDPQDVYYLLPDEIDIRIIPKFSAHKLVAMRKKQHEEFRKADLPPFIGDPSVLPETLGREPLLSSTAIPLPRVRPELKADLYGTISAPGIVEGTARVILSEEEFDQVQPGEILVTLETSAVWTPLFSLVKGIVTEVGGVLTHAFIVGREYGLPVVSGTVEATKKIQTGMRLKVDGDLGVVYILPE
jgi:pyruvate,water dikinase